MINELEYLFQALNRGGVHTKIWHAKYKPLPNVSKNNPCVRLIIAGGHIVRIEAISAEIGKQLRRFGTNQGFFPGVNLQPLYRLNDDKRKNELQKIIKGQKKSDITEIRSLCKDDNWNSKFLNKYRRSMKESEELRKIIHDEWDGLNILLDEIKPFLNPDLLRSELEKAALRLLEYGTDCALAFRILFCICKKADDCGNLSVIFDSQRLIEKGIPVAGVKFTDELNQRLLKAGTSGEQQSGKIQDAFGDEYLPGKKTMPAVK